MNISPILDSPEATTLSIYDLLRYVKNGKIKIPPFQREFRWEPEDMLKLLDSIYRGYPIGNLLFWETDIVQGVRSTFGSVTIEANSKDTWLIIDGQQRIKTLVGILLRPKDQESEKHWYVYFDLKEGEFKIPKGKTTPQDYWLPLREIADTMEFLTWLRHLTDKTDKNEAESLINSANRVAKAIRDYKIPAYIVKTGDQAIVREIFNRLNNTGKSLTASEVFNAIYGRKDDGEPIDLSSVRTTFKKYGFGTIEEQDLLKSILAILDVAVNIKLSKARDTLKNYNEKIIHETITHLHDVLETVMSFLKEYAGISHLSLLPYSFLLIPLIKFFYLFPKASEESKEKLSRWLWRGTVSGLFHRITAQPMTEILANIKEDNEIRCLTSLMAMEKLKNIYPEIKMKYVGKANATTKIFYNYLVFLKPKDFITSKEFDIQAIIEEEGAKAFQTFSRIRNKAVISDEHLEKGFCNKFFYPSSEIRQIRIDNIHPQILQSHAIPIESIRHWKEGSIEEFLRIRNNFLKEELKKYLAERCGEKT